MDQYALISADGRMLEFVDSPNVVTAVDLLCETYGIFPEGAYVINLTQLLGTL